MGTFTTSMQGMVDIRSQYSYQELFHDEDAKSDEKKKQKNQKKEITLKNCSSLAKSYINTMIRQKKSNNLFVYDTKSGMIFYACTSCAIYRKVSVLEFFIIKLKIPKYGIKALELTIKNKTIF